MIYFHLSSDIIKKNCNFDIYYSKTDITPTVLYGGNKIILANWPKDKHIICSVNNDIPTKISSHPYILVNRSALCNCGLEVENHFLLESLAACHEANLKLVVNFRVNTTFINYLGEFPNLTESLAFLIIKKKITFEQTLPISLNASKFDSNLLTTPMSLKDFIHQYNHRKEMFHLKDRHDTMALTLSKISFLTIMS